MESESTVFVVDDDPEMRRSLTRLLEEVNLHIQAYASAQEFLDAYDPALQGCLVLDVRMPGLSGMGLLERLAAEKIHIPTLVITGYGDVPTAVRAIKAGAIDFIEKPFRAPQLLDRIREALALAEGSQAAKAAEAELATRLALLSVREREVLRLLAEGKSVREVASEADRSYKTVDKQKTGLMQKLDVHSRAELVRLAIRARVVEA